MPKESKSRTKETVSMFLNDRDKYCRFTLHSYRNITESVFFFQLINFNQSVSEGRLRSFFNIKSGDQLYTYVI